MAVDNWSLKTGAESAIVRWHLSDAHCQLPDAKVPVPAPAPARMLELIKSNLPNSATAADEPKTSRCKYHYEMTDINQITKKIFRWGQPP